MKIIWNFIKRFVPFCMLSSLSSAFFMGIIMTIHIAVTANPTVSIHQWASVFEFVLKIIALPFVLTLLFFFFGFWLYMKTACICAGIMLLLQTKYPIFKKLVYWLIAGFLGGAYVSYPFLHDPPFEINALYFSSVGMVGAYTFHKLWYHKK